MTDPITNNSAGRPYIDIDWNKVDQMLVGGCTGLEIAAEIGIHKDTLYDRTREKFGVYFSDYAAQKYSKGDGMLKVAQFAKAMKGNTQMQIFLGRVRLKQIEAQAERDHLLPPLETILLLEDELIRTKAQLKKYENATKSETGTELSRSDSPL